MASARIPYNATTVIGVKIRLVMQQLAQARQTLGEFAQEMAAYAGDTTALATDSGIASGSCQAFLDQISRANSEANGTMTIANYGSPTATSYWKTLCDNMA